MNTCRPRRRRQHECVQLLQRFEPIVRYTQGEMFFPAAIEPYVNLASLWMHTPAGKDQQVVPPG